MFLQDGQQAGGIIGGISDYKDDLEDKTYNISQCFNTGIIQSNSINARGITGGIVGCSTGTNVVIEKCFNIGKICNNDYNSNTLDVSGGIVGLLSESGNVQYSYSSCEFEDGDVKGEIVGQWNTTSTANVLNCYYTNENIKGIGSKGTVNTEISAQEDVSGVTEKTNQLPNFEAFKKWIKNKFPSISFI